MACGGMIFIKNFKLKKNNFFLNFITFNFLMLLLLHKNLKRQSEHSGLRLDTSSVVHFVQVTGVNSYKF